MLDVQTIVALILVAGAVAFAGTAFWKKTRSFSAKNAACADDCGCGSKSKTPKIAH